MKVFSIKPSVGNRYLSSSMHGTFNWTNAANYNKENWDVDHNRETAKKFAEEFVKMRRDAELSMKNDSL